MTARISIIRTGHPVIQTLLQQGRDYSIGRDERCDISVDDAELSRLHARLSYADGQWTVQDANSKNGLSVNGRRCTTAPLTKDSWLGLGSFALRFELLSATQLQRANTHSDMQRQLTMDGCDRMGFDQDVARVLRRLMDSALSISDAQRAFVMLTRPDGDLEVACSHGVNRQPMKPGDFVGSSTAVKTVLSTRRSVVTCDAASHDQLSSKQSIISAHTRALVCLPLTVFDRVLGLIYADSQIPGKFFTELDVKLLTELADHAALIVAAAQLNDEIETISDQTPRIVNMRQRLATLQHKLPDAGSTLSGGRYRPLTGMRWSWIESQR